MKLSELTMPEVNYLRQNGNFTDDEDVAFVMLTRGKTLTEIAIKLSVSETTVDRIVSRIKRKISRIGGMNNG